MLYDNTEIKRFNSTIIVDELRDHQRNEAFVVLWANGMRKPASQRNFQPKVFLAIQSLSKKRTYPHCDFLPVSVSNMTHITPGTVWESGQLVGRIQNNRHEFSIDNDSCETMYLSDALTKYGAPPLISAMWNNSQLHDVMMMDFYSSDGKHILIPCIEYFLRGYGVSGELRRVLTTYNFESEGRQRLLPSFPLRKNGPEWQIKKPGASFHNNDRFFLANLKYRQTSQNAAKKIYSSLETNFNNSTAQLASMDVIPWYDGKSTVIVEGEYIHPDCFWVWNLAGMSLPQCEKILFITEKKKTIHRRPDEKQGSEDSGAAPRVFHQPPKQKDSPTTLVSDAPDIDGPPLLLLGEPFQFIADQLPNTVFETIENDVETGGGIKEKDDANAAGGGDRWGKGKGVGKAVTVQAIETVDGVILDLWDALSKMKEKYTPQICNLSWVNVSEGHVEEICDNQPHLIPLQDFNLADDINLEHLLGDKFSNVLDKEKYLKSCSRWLSAFGDERCRGISIFSMTILDKKYFIAEIERESTVAKNSLNSGAAKEKGYRGLIFSVDKINEYSYIRYLLDNVRFTQGMRPVLAWRCSGEADVFKHSKSASDHFKGESAIKNAFSKMGIKFKVSK